ncbi:MAG: hypothetical protein MJZ09_04615 [Bacteroidales bacterium]|nr:hypothetical protein [Bacteroidales bacterium]
MSTAAKEQTAFRLAPELISMMKQRSRALDISVNTYVTNLIIKDLEESRALPKIDLPKTLDDDILKLSGIISCPSQDELDTDERLKRIWCR